MPLYQDITSVDNGAALIYTIGAHYIYNDR